MGEQWCILEQTLSQRTPAGNLSLSPNADGFTHMRTSARKQPPALHPLCNVHIAIRNGTHTKPTQVRMILMLSTCAGRKHKQVGRRTCTGAGTCTIREPQDIGRSQCGDGPTSLPSQPQTIPKEHGGRTSSNCTNPGEDGGDTPSDCSARRRCAARRLHIRGQNN